MMRNGCIAALCALTLALGCQAEDLDDNLIGEQARPIIGGSEVPSAEIWPFVVRLDIGGTCTGTLVAPNVILTAAHCVEGFFGGSARFGTSSPWEETIGLEEAVIHRAFAGFKEKDIALIRMASEATFTEPVAFNKQPIDESWVGVEVTTVGFGNNVPPTGGDPSTGTGAGIMRQVSYAIDGVTAEHILLGDMNENTCQGDSGGPTFAMIEGEPVVMAVTSFGTFNCQGQSNVTRTDVYQHDFLNEVIAAWYGPCSLDGVCDTEQECEFLDPDCDICGFDGVCGQECETVDLDCALGGLAGDTCEDKYDCESRACITAPDDPRVKYCSAECDEGLAAGDQCDVPLSACGKADGGSYCLFAGPTPGTQGAPCTDGEECLGACDTDNAICVEPCSSNSDCADEFECRSLSGTKVCTVPKGGSCRVSSDDGGGQLLWFGLALLGLVAIRRRRR